MHRLPIRTAALIASTGLLAVALAAEKLPSDERIQTGTLGNGVKWMYRQHDNPPGKMALMIHVDTGSLNETEEQRGLAHFLEHMAFNGTENFKPGELIPYFESIGMEFGPDLNAFTSFDQTVYMLFLPDTKVETVDKGLMVLSDYAFRMTLLSEEIDQERGVILAELRAGLSAQQRIRDKLFETLFEGTRFGQRLPIGIEKVIQDAPRAEFEAYYRTWYRPEHVTLMMVGDAGLDDYRPAVEKWFGQYKATAEARSQATPGFKPFTKERAIVLSDPEYATGDVDMFNILPKRPPTTTVEQYRVELVEELGSWIVHRRFSDRVKKGEATYREATASVTSFFNDGVLVSAGAVGEPKDWEKMLDEVIVEVNRARDHGFLPQELALAGKELLANAEHAVRTEPTRNAREVIREMAAAVNNEEPVLSARRRLDLLKRLLPEIKLEEVSRAFAANYKAGAFAYVLTMPKKDELELPTEEEVLAAARAAHARKVEAHKWEDKPTTLLEKEPQPGRVVESAKDEDLGITCMWLDNGVRLHHRFMDYKKDTIFASITLAGGEIEETAENAGMTTVASLAFKQPATSRLRSTDIEDIMTGKNIDVDAAAQGDTFTVSVTGSPADLEIGLQLAHALLTDGKIEQTAFDRWKEKALQDYAMYSKFPQFAAAEVLLDLTSGGDPRRTMMTPKKIEAQSLERSQAWLRRLCRKAPIEVAVVGEMQLDEVLPLILKYVGSLPKRDRGAAHLDPLRKLNRKVGPLERRISVDTITPQAMVLCGFMSCQIRDVSEVRALTLASLVLDSQLIKKVREEAGLVYSIQAHSAPAETYDDSGVFLSGAPCAPAKADEVVRQVEAIYTAFAESGPTPEELDNAKKQVQNNLDIELKEPRWWFDRLQDLDLRKLKLADLKNIPEAYQALTAEQVQNVFKKYYVAARTFRVVALPSGAEPQPQSQPEKKEPAPAGAS